MTLISLIRYFNEARPTLRSPAAERRIQTRRLCDFALPLSKQSYFRQVFYTFFSSHIRPHSWKVCNSLTSPSEDCKRRSFLQYAVKSPTPALTSTPLGASRVNVRVGDSSLKQTRTHTCTLMCSCKKNLNNINTNNKNKNKNMTAQVVSAPAGLLWSSVFI